MADDSTLKYSIDLSFEEIRLPPFQDILIVGRKCPQGKIGLSKSFEYLVPNEFLSFNVDDEIVEAVFINKRVLNKIDKESVMRILKEKVFPYVSECEILKIDFKVRMYYSSLEEEV